MLRYLDCYYNIWASGRFARLSDLGKILELNGPISVDYLDKA
jgi:hypothetical protein